MRRGQQKPSNRSWCDSCDRAMVELGKKCPACNKRRKDNRPRVNYKHKGVQQDED